MGPFEASRLDPLLDAVLGTGYKALTQIFVWNIPLRNTDILVLARYVVCASSVIFGAREFCVAHTFTSHSLFATSRVSQKDQCLSSANLIARQSYCSPPFCSILIFARASVFRHDFIHASLLTSCADRVSTSHLKSLARYLESPKATVSEVEFMHNELSPFAFGRIGEALSFNRAVKRLSFLHNDTGGNTGAVSLCKVRLDAGVCDARFTHASPLSGSFSK